MSGFKFNLSKYGFTWNCLIHIDLNPSEKPKLSHFKFVLDFNQGAEHSDLIFFPNSPRLKLTNLNSWGFKFKSGVKKTLSKETKFKSECFAPSSNLNPFIWFRISYVQSNKLCPGLEWNFSSLSRKIHTLQWVELIMSICPRSTA